MTPPAVALANLVMVAAAAARTESRLAQPTPTPPRKAHLMTITVPSFVLDATPGVHEATAKLEAAHAARAAIRLEYPVGVRPLNEVSRHDSLAPRPGVSGDEFETSRVTRETYDLAVADADRAITRATEGVRAVAYGFGLEPAVIAARQESAADRLVEVDHLLETASLTLSERNALEAERVLAKRYALVSAASALEDVERGGSVRLVSTDGRVIIVDATSVRTNDDRIKSVALADGRLLDLGARY